MKKLLLPVFICILFTHSYSQVNDHALGVRFGYGGGISYQQGLNNLNRLEVNLGFSLGSYYSAFVLTAVYQWVFPLKGGFNWYIGPAATLGSWSVGDTYTGKKDGGFFLSAGGQLGLEYNFAELPLQISIDVIPEAGIINGYNDFYFDPAFAVRYVF